jgi:hypothetical protein
MRQAPNHSHSADLFLLQKKQSKPRRRKGQHEMEGSVSFGFTLLFGFFPFILNSYAMRKMLY